MPAGAIPHALQTELYAHRVVDGGAVLRTDDVGLGPGGRGRALLRERHRATEEGAESQSRDQVSTHEPSPFHRVETLYTLTSASMSEPLVR